MKNHSWPVGPRSYLAGENSAGRLLSRRGEEISLRSRAYRPAEDGKRVRGNTCDACIRRDAIIGRFARPAVFASSVSYSRARLASAALDSLTDALRNQPRDNRARIIYPSPLSYFYFRRVCCTRPLTCDCNVHFF